MVNGQNTALALLASVKLRYEYSYFGDPRFLTLAIGFLRPSNFDTCINPPRIHIPMAITSKYEYSDSSLSLCHELSFSGGSRGRFLLAPLLQSRTASKVSLCATLSL